MGAGGTEAGCERLGAAVPEDSSGGPVVDDGGNVVGVATVLPREGETLTFAVPVENVRELLELCKFIWIFLLSPPSP